MSKQEGKRGAPGFREREHLRLPLDERIEISLDVEESGVRTFLGAATHPARRVEEEDRAPRHTRQRPCACDRCGQLLREHPRVREDPEARPRLLQPLKRVAQARQIFALQRHSAARIRPVGELVQMRVKWLELQVGRSLARSQLAHRFHVSEIVARQRHADGDCGTRALGAQRADSGEGCFETCAAAHGIVARRIRRIERHRGVRERDLGQSPRRVTRDQGPVSVQVCAHAAHAAPLQ